MKKRKQKWKQKFIGFMAVFLAAGSIQWPANVVSATTAADNVIYEQDFEDVSEGDVLPAGWSKVGIFKEANTAAVITESGNKVLEFVHNEAQGSGNNIGVRYTYANPLSKFVLKYKVKADNVDGSPYLLNTGGIDLTFQSSKLKQQDSGGWVDVASVNANQWYSIEMTVDMEAKTYTLKLDGTQVHSGTVKGSASESKEMSIGAWQGTTNTKLYLDDISIEKYVESEQPADDIIYSANFEDVTDGQMPSDWTHSAGAEVVTAIETSNENKVLKIEQPVISTEEASKGNTVFTKQLDAVNSKVVLSYSVAPMIANGALYLPSGSNNQGLRMLNLALNKVSNEYCVAYEPTTGGWAKAAALNLGEWNTIKIVYDSTGDSPSCELYVNDDKVDISNAKINDISVSRINMFTYRSSAGLYYIDNLKMTADDHDPEKPAELLAEIPEGDISYSQNFDEATVGTALPTGWTYFGVETGNSVSVVTESDGNNVLKMDHSNRQNGNMGIKFAYNGGASASKFVYKYRVKTESNDGAVYLPNPDGVTLTINGGKLQRNDDGTGWKDIIPTAIKVGEWYSIEMVVDINKKAYDLYLDGELVLENGTVNNASGISNSLSIGAYRQTGNIFYFDDIEITNYVKGETARFANESYTVAKDSTLRMELDFAPENASRRSAKFESSNPAVATVNDLGIVTGISEGTVTITATPNEEGLSAVTTQLKVENIKPTDITVTADTIVLPEDGHVFLGAAVAPKNTSNQKLHMSSNNSNVATVDEWGEVVAIGEGTAAITIVSDEDSNVTKTVTVNVAARQEAMTKIYVSENGDDNNDGSEYSPVQTLAKAQELVREANDDMSGDIQVILTDGYYHLDETFVLSEEDGGTNNHYVIWSHEGSGEAVIGSKREITGFKLYDADKNIYVADAAGLETRQLFVDNVKAVRARSESGLLYPTTLMNGNKNVGYICDNVELLSFAKPTDLELVFHEQWTNPRCGVANITEEGGKVHLTMDQPGWDRLLNKGGTAPTIPVYLENALEFLDEPGEWYLDTEEGKLYYMPRAWENMGTVSVTAPVLEELVKVEGTDYDNMVENIEFRGITFADTTWMRPSTNEALPDVQNNHLRELSADHLPGASIIVNRANSIRFTGCTFTRLGCTAVRLEEGVQNSPITGCTFYDISGSAINIADSNLGDVDHTNPSDIRKLVKNCDVTNCYIHDIGRDYKSAAAISVAFAANVDLTHNEICNVPYSGFHLGYGWENRFENVLKNMRVENNFIHDIMGEEIFDGGAVYTLGNSGGNADSYNIIQNNYIRNQMNAHAPLYADQGTTYWKWENNVVDLSEVDKWVGGLEPRWALVNQKTEHLQVNNIYTTTAVQRVESDGKIDVNFNNIHVYEADAWPDEAKTIIENSGLEAAYAGLRSGYTERLSVNTDESIVLNANETFQVLVSATDGKDKAVDMEHAAVYYRIIDTDIATVSENGLVTGVSKGQTVLEISVVSGDILEVIEKEVYVGDTIKRIELEGIENNMVYLGTEVESMQVTAYGVTDMDRRADIENAVYQIADTSIATVTDTGLIRPVSAGTTTLTVSTTVGQNEVSTDLTIVVETAGEFAAENMWEIFEAENEGHWKGTEGVIKVTDGVSASGKLYGFVTYDGAKYRNSLMQFKIKIDTSTGGGGWPSIVLRAQDTVSYVGANTNGYIICFGSGGLQVQRFNGATRRVFIGTVGELVGDQHASMDNPLTHGVEHDVKIGAANTADGVRLYLMVDSEVIYDFVDTDADAIKTPGYFGLVGRNETFTLTKDTSISDEPVVEGDFDNNGKADLTDIAAIYNAVTAGTEFTEEQKKVADVNKDGKVTLADMAQIYNSLQTSN